MTPPLNSPSSSEAYPRFPWSWIIQLGGLLVAFIVVFILSMRYPLLEYLGNARSSVEHLGIWSGLVYPFAYAGCNLLLLPGGVLSIGGGFFFGLWWGFAIVLSGNLLGAATAFIIARRLGRQRIERWLLNNRRFRLLDRAIDRHGWKIIVLSQLNPLAPSSLLNYLYGLTRVDLKRCLLWIALGQTPGLFLYTFVGTLGQFGIEMARGRRHPFAHEYLIWGAGFLLTIVTTYLLGRLARRIMDEAETEIEDLP
ncbi:MAG: VTT domain-containing protein [Verrucomicrobia bacterium]|nr:VTT domain-containing protein [Verrucomicrobiota bacterium]